MEPSLRSSNPRGSECKLRQPLPALQETIQRFVESLSSDIRISQYADLVYAGKRMEKGKWLWLQPLPGGTVGYLVLGPRHPAVWIDGGFKRAYQIPLRVSFHAFEQPTVFVASLNKTSAVLRLEDLWMFAGEPYMQKTFQQRWKTLMRFYCEQYKPDVMLQQGLQIEMAVYESLNCVKEWGKMPDIVYAVPDVGTRRLRVVSGNGSGSGSRGEAAKSSKPAAVPQKPLFIDDTPEEPTAAAAAMPPADDNVRAIPHEEYPDTYNIWIKGVKKGYAAVQDIELSRVLREAAKDKKELFVSVEWNEEFKMYEILSML